MTTFTLTPAAHLTDLLEAAVRGDHTAWRDLLERHQRLVSHVVARYRLSPDDAADVIQTTWLRLIENIASIRDPACLPGWLSTTAARESLAARRRRSREVSIGDYDATDPQQVDVDDLVSAKLRAGHLRQAMVTLPQRERRLVEVLLSPEEPSYREISDQLGMPVGSIGPVRQRALHRLRTSLAEDDPGTETHAAPMTQRVPLRRRAS